MAINNTICPDCEQNILVSQSEKQNGLCLSCSRRKRIANSLNRPYTKYKDLSTEEKQRLEKQRGKKVSTTSIAKDNPKGIGRGKTYSQDLHDFVKSLNNETIPTILSLLKYKFPEYSYFTESTLRSFMTRNKYEYASRRSNTNENIIKVRNLKNVIYTSDVIMKLKEIASEDKTSGELMQELKELYPDKNITAGNFVNIIGRHNIVHKKGRASKEDSYLSDRALNKLQDKKNPIIRTTIINHDEEIPTEIITKVKEEDYIPCDEDCLDINIEEKALNYGKYLEDDNISDEERLKPIQEEVDKILINKFKKDNCYNDIPFTTEDYIKMLQMLLYINENKNIMTRNGTKQHNIMDLYEDDIVHEAENILLPRGNTYFQDKLHVLRNKRRDLEYNGGDIAIMRDFLNTINNDTLKLCISNLKADMIKRQNFKYIPNVDETMIDKYDWCLHPSKRTPVAKQPIVVVPAVMSAKGNKTRKQVMNIYRVSCQLSGAGYGAFTSYYRDYEAINEDAALTYGKQELDKMKREKPGLLVQNINIHKLNKEGSVV